LECARLSAFAQHVSGFKPQRERAGKGAKTDQSKDVLHEKKS